MKIIYLGGKQAGCVGLLTLLAAGHDITCVIPYSNDVSSLARAFKLVQHNSVNSWQAKAVGDHSDLLVCVHGRELVDVGRYNNCYFGGINVHPCLTNFPGKSPIKRFLESTYYPNATVGIHRITETIDQGEILIEIPVNVTEAKTEIEVYNTLYPYYSLALLEALKRI